MPYHGGLVIKTVVSYIVLAGGY